VLGVHRLRHAEQDTRNFRTWSFINSGRVGAARIVRMGVVDCGVSSLSRRTFLSWAAAAGLAGCAANKLPSEGSTAPVATDATAATSGSASSTEAARTTAAAPESSALPAVTAAPEPTTFVATTAKPSTMTPGPGAGDQASFINHGARDSGNAALTFHAAGNPAMATALLDLLKRSGTPVTVFAVGSWISENPQLAKRILADGHELSNHTWSHGAMRTMSPADLTTEISKAADALTKLTGSNGRWFRPSQIEVPTPAILTAAGKVGYGVSVGYDLDSMDFQDPGAAAVKKNVMGAIQSGSIVSLHFDHQNTIDALPAIIDHMKSKNLKPVTVSQLIG
jgi:peptidoglycan/xylan/chitin deacetylase (PgdA/CDA1 family)